ncbi:MAG: hypothetical protein Q4B58_08050, partial [Bacteroidales bacterium]|nr:hypothetical protein [Bacteroidales bacterium]
MIYRLKLLSAFTIALLSTNLCAQGRFNSETESWLKRLDAVVAEREQINVRKSQELDKMRLQGSRIASAEELYQHNCKIYDACFTFNSELAMEVVDANLALARQSKDKNRTVLWTINRSFILASTGLLLEASNAIQEINAQELPHELQLCYYDQMQYMYQHMSQYSWDKQLKELYDDTQRHYSDSIYQIL